jgi:hypothetical protein
MFFLITLYIFQICAVFYALGCGGSLPELGSSSAPPHTGPYSDKAHGTPAFTLHIIEGVEKALLGIQ